MVAELISGEAPKVVVDVIDLGPGLLGWGDPTVTAAVAAVQSSDIVVVASPTFKAAYTGLVKLFLDQIPTNGLAGVVGVPLMLGAAWGHALAPEVFLKPVLTELGASCPTRALYLLETDFDNPKAVSGWLADARPLLVTAIGGRPAVSAPEPPSTD